MLKRAEELFLRVFKGRTIDSIEEIPKGYSNRTFRVNSGKDLFKVRIACNNNIIDRKNEHLILTAILDEGCVFYDTNSGDGIWKWIEGENVTKDQIDLSFLVKVVGEMKRFHSVSREATVGILSHDDSEFLNSTEGCLESDIVDLYIYLVNKYSFDSRTLCHNDVSLSNLIYNPKNNGLFLIDYEWGRINSPYWDYGNFVKESDLDEDFARYLSIIAGINTHKLFEYCFMAAVYSWQLSFSFPEKDSLKEYRSRVKGLIIKYMKWIRR